MNQRRVLRLTAKDLNDEHGDLTETGGPPPPLPKT